MYDRTVDDARDTEIPLQRGACLLNVARTEMRRNNGVWNRSEQLEIVQRLHRRPFINKAEEGLSQDGTFYRGSNIL